VPQSRDGTPHPRATARRIRAPRHATSARHGTPHPRATARHIRAPRHATSARHGATRSRSAQREKRDAHATPKDARDDDAHFARVRVRILLTRILSVQIA
jgi:hypothetical protein